MKAIDRLYLYFEAKGIKPTRFEKDCGLSNGYLGTQKKRSGSLGEDVLCTVIDNCRDLDIEWLLTGNGSMIRDEHEDHRPQLDGFRDKKLLDAQEKIITMLEDKISCLSLENERIKKERSSQCNTPSVPVQYGQKLGR